MRATWYRVLPAVALVTSCGGAATDVAVAPDGPSSAVATVPVTAGRPAAQTLLPPTTMRVATTSTAVGRATTTAAPSPSRRALTGNDVADIDAFNTLGAVLNEGASQGYGDLTSADFSDFTIVAGDRASAGPTSVSLAVDNSADGIPFGVAVRSASGTCLWYAMVDGIDYLGTGKVCTGDAAMGNRHVVAPADSPWRLVLTDGKIAAMQVALAQLALESSLFAVRAYYYAGDSTLSQLTAAALHDEEPSIEFVDGQASEAPRTVSFAVEGQRFGAAALADDGTCYWVTEDFATPDFGRGHGDPCTGAAALSAQGLGY